MATKYTKNSAGYFHTMIWDGTYTDKGKKHYKQVYSKKSSADLEKKVNAIRQQVKDREYVHQDGTMFHDYCIHWLKTYKASTSDNTRRMYLNIIEKHFDGIVCTISELNRSHYATMMNGISGIRTKQQASMTFKQIVKSAIHDKMLPPNALEDIFDGTEKVKYKSKEKRPLTDAEKDAIKKVELSDRDRLFLLILYGCGLRRGECIALTRTDVDLTAFELNVDKAIAFVEMDVIRKDTKNEKHRKVPIPELLRQPLSEYVKDMDDDALLFSMRDGKPLTKSSFDKMWRRILTALQKACIEPIEGLTPHILRHNYCTTLCYQIPAIGINDIAYIMGDSKEVVLNIYNHLNMDDKKVQETVSAALKF